MLDAITDFWKPSKKSQQPNKLKLTDMQIGSTISFGYVPQAALSGKKFTVSAINSYQFGQDVLTSFLLNNEKEAEISMIIAEAQGEQYLAISRRISIDFRNKLFDNNAIEQIINDQETTKFSCRDNIPELKGWMVTNYKREIQGMRGNIYHADFRNGHDKLISGNEFQYTLLGSNSNEHAIEIETYSDGKIDIYATIYRRTSDIAEIIYSVKSQSSEMKLIKKEDAEESHAENAQKISLENPIIQDTNKAEELSKPEFSKTEPAKLEEVALPQLTATPLVPEIPKNEPAIIETKNIKNNNEEKENMNITTVLSNDTKPNLTNGHQATPSFENTAVKDFKQEIKTVTKTTNGMDNEAIECELRVANQIIDEAIRNEMRLSDVVRRIIELPVAHQEAVQIPLNLADEDFSLLAIRYGIPSSDRNAIKLRIIQELGDFSGNKKKAA